MSQEYWNLSDAGDSVLIDSSQVFTVFPTTADAFIIESFGVADWIALAAFSFVLVFVGCLIGTIKRLKWKRSIGMRSSIIGVSLASLLILVVYGLYLTQRAPMAGDNVGIAWYAQYGDAFGVVTSFFTAMGTIGLIVTIVLQYQTLKAQKEELAETRKEVQGQRLELEGQKILMDQQTNILREQQETNSLKFFLDQYKELKEENKNSIITVSRIFKDANLFQANQIIHQRKTRIFLELIDQSLPGIEKINNRFMLSLSEDEVIFLILSTSALPDENQNIKALLKNLTYKELSKIITRQSLSPQYYEILDQGKLDIFMSRLNNVNAHIPCKTDEERGEIRSLIQDLTKLINLGILNVIESEICKRTGHTPIFDRHLLFNFEAADLKSELDNFIIEYKDYPHIKEFIEDNYLSDVDGREIDNRITKLLANTLFKPEPELE